MASFGGKLQRERKRRKLTIEQVAATTKIGVRYLTALEQNQFESLPGGVFNRGYVRAYAKAVGADPEELVQAYIAAEQAHGIDDRTEDIDLLKKSLEASVSRRDSPAAPRDAHRMRTGALTGLLAVTLLALGVWYYTGPRPAHDRPDRAPSVASVTTTEPAVEPTVESTGDPAIATLVASKIEQPAEPPPTRPATETPPPPVREAVRPAPGDPSAQRLSVSHSGVGSGVVNHQLQGRTDRFEQGAEAWYWTRVVGGRSGEKIRHVWYHEGRRIGESVLSLGGSHWRTHSRRTLRQGGQWTVEVRDEQNRVLAQEHFFCEGTDDFRPRRQNLAGMQ